MALNFRKVGVKAGVFSCSLAAIPAAPKEVVKDMMGKPVTLTQVGINKRDKGAYALFTVSEYPDFAFSAGEMFNKLVDAWMQEVDPAYEGFDTNECEALNKEIEAAGGVTIIVSKHKNTRDPSRSDYWFVNVI